MPEPAGSASSRLPGAMAALPPSPLRGGRAALLAALLLAVFMGALDASMLNLVFRDLIDDFASSPAVVVWVALGYLIAAAVPMSFMARIGAAIGHGRNFQIGVILYGVASVLCATAPDIGGLIALRVLQGLGFAMFVPSAVFLAAATDRSGQGGHALGVLIAAGATGLVLGAPLAGWLLDLHGWRAIFLARLPLVVLAILLAVWALRRESRVDRSRLPGLREFAETLLLAAGSFGTLYGITRLPAGYGHGDVRAWAILGAGLATLVFMVRRCSRPLRTGPVPGSQQPGLAAASLASVAMFASLSPCLFILPLALLGGPEVRAWTVGLLLASLAAAAALVYRFAGKWSARLGREWSCVLGVVCVGIGHVILVQTGLRAPLWQLALPMVPVGLGVGLFLEPNAGLLMQGVAPPQVSLARGFVGTLRLGGLALGFALMASLTTLLQERLGYVWDGRAGTLMPAAEALRIEQIFQRGGAWSADVLTLVLQVGAWLTLAILLLAGLYSMRRRGSPLRQHLLAAGAAVVFAALAIPASWQRSGVVGTAAPVVAHAGVAQPPVAPFGMVARARVELPPLPGASGHSGAEVFAGLCAACHGQDGRGLPPPQGFAIDLTRSRFVAENPDATLAEFIRNGRAVDDPRNVTGMPMPAMRDLIPDERIELVVQHLRRLGR